MKPVPRPWRVFRLPALEWLEPRLAPAAHDTLATAAPISLPPATPTVLTATLAPGDADYYQFAVGDAERLTAQVHATGFAARLSLFGPNDDSTPLIQSDGQSPANPDDLIVQYVGETSAGATYSLKVQGLAGGGPYSLTIQLDPATTPFPPPAAVTSPVAVVAGDFNNDGVPDLVSADGTSGRIAIQLGRGDGTFQAPQACATISPPTSLIAADLNGDGRLDLAVASADGLVVLLGTGDGTFRPQPTITLPAGRPLAVVAGDFNGDHHLDLAAADSTDGVWVFLGTGRGTFEPAGRFDLPDGAGPTAMTAGDFEGRGRLSLAVAEGNRDAVAVLPGRGDGTFGLAVEYRVQVDPVSLVAADFTGAGRDDLAVANHGGQGEENDGSVSMLLSNPGGTFQDTDPDAISQGVGSAPVAIAVGHFNGNGHNALDLATAESTYGTTSILIGHGDGTFVRADGPSVGGAPAALAVADFDGSGSSDLAVGNGLSAPSAGVTVSLETPLPGADPPFFFNPPTAAASPRPTPLLADVNGDGIKDSVIVSRAGAILLRPGLASPPGAFAPAIRVNPTDRPARAVAVVPAGAQTWLAATDRLDDDVSLYAVDAGGHSFFLRSLPVESGSLPTRILAGNFRGVRDSEGNFRKVQDGHSDLAVLNAATGRVTWFLSDGQGGLGPAMTTDLGGSGRFDMTLADLQGDGRPDDIVVVDQLSGDVNVLVNNGEGSDFTRELYRAGAGPYGISSDGTAVVSGEGTVGAVAGDFDGDGMIDLVTANADSHSLALLRGRGDGSFFNPVPLPLDFSPAAIAVGRFDGGAFLGLAVLDRDAGRVRIFLGDGQGHFHEQASAIPLWAGDAPANLSVADVDGDGIADVQVGDDFGDVLTFLGNGDGTFRPYQRADRAQTIGLAVADGEHFVLSNQARDRLAVQDGIGGASRIFADSADGIKTPGQVQTVNVGGTEYLVVANGGANDVLVYRGVGNGQFDAASVQTFFTGTDPVAVTVADVNGDGVPDVVVANQGSNDVSVLFGRGQGPAWTLTAGPRLAAGGTGPVSTTVADVTGDGVPDVLIVNRQSNSVTLLPGVGNGFFNDRGPTTFATGAGPVQALVGNFDGGPGLLTLNAGANDLTLFSRFGPGLSLASGGLEPLAGFAGDFNADGFTDVVIANNGDGVFTALLGGPDGPRLAATLSSADVPHPTAVALADLTGGALSIYATEEGQEAVARLTFAFIAVVTELPPSAPVAQGTGLAGAELLLVATLLSGGPAEPGAVAAPEAAPAAEVFAVFVPPAAGPGSAPVAGAGGGVAEVAAAPPAAGWEGYPLGVGEAIGRRARRQEAAERLDELLDVLGRVLDELRHWLPAPAAPAPTTVQPPPLPAPMACAESPAAMTAARDTAAPPGPPSGAWELRPALPVSVAAVVGLLGCALRPACSPRSRRRLTVVRGGAQAQPS